MATGFVHLIFICSVILLFDVKTNTQELVSPCPRLFVYEPKGSEPDKWHGIITLISDSELTGVWLRVIFDSPPIQIGNWFGEVVLKDENTDYLIKNRNFLLPANSPQTLKFFVKYDPSKPVPRLVSFRLNGRTLCPEGQATTAPPPKSSILFTNKVTESTTSITPVPLAPLKNRPASTNNNNFRPPGFHNGDYFEGDFNLNSKPIGAGSNVECGTLAVQVTPLVAYGQKTKAGEFPWHAALYHSKGVEFKYICGGSLISQMHVLTVAHCVTSPRSQLVLPTDDLLVYLGKYYLKKWSNPGIQDHKISRIVTHPNYDSRIYSNDIAVMTLMQPAEYTNFVRPICLWEGPSDYNHVTAKYGTVVGWGFDENGKLTEELTMLHMPIIPKESCIYSFPEFYARFASNETFCAGFGNGSSVCNGDSGGGMIFPRKTENPNRKVYQIRGLVSVSVALQNDNKCDLTHYVIFTDVAKYIDFIKQAIAE